MSGYMILGALAVVIFMGFAFYGIRSNQVETADHAEAIRVRIKGQGGQNITVDKVNTPYLSGAILFTVRYTDETGRQIINRVTVHTAGEHRSEQFWGDPVTPV